MGKFFTTIKPICGWLAAGAAGKVTTDIIKEFTSGRTTVIMNSKEDSRVYALGVSRNVVEKAVLSVGTFVIAGAVAAYVGRQVANEVDEIEELIAELRADTEEVLKEVQNA